MKNLKLLSIPKFGKKEENEELVKEEKLEEVKKRKPRKKKEPPPKPWGKIERLIVLLFLASAPLFSIFFLLRSKDSKFAKPISIPAPNIIKNVIPVTQKDTTELKKTLEKELTGLNGTYSVWLESLDGNFSLGINENQKMEGASLFKLPLMVAYYKAVEAGKISPSTRYSLKHSDAQSGAGTLANLTPGTVITYKDMIEAMGKNSDNTAFSIMESILGLNAIDNLAKDIGMENTDILKSTTTSYDIGLLFNKVISGQYISSQSKDEFLSFLTDTDFENLIPAGIPNIKVAHKYGSFNAELNDAGVILSSRPFILSIMSNGAGNDEAERVFPRITKIIYDWTLK